MTDDDDIPTDAQMTALRERWAQYDPTKGMALTAEDLRHISWALRAAQQCIPFRKSGHTIPGPPSALGTAITHAVEQFEAADPPERCPHCGANLVGDEIPENRRLMVGGVTHYSRILAIYDREQDRTTHYECPDCGSRIE